MITILLVEDNEMVRLTIKAKLSAHFQIREASNGLEALELLDHVHVDLMIVDVMMPQMNGYELVRSLRESGDNTPVIMLTAMTSFEHKREGFSSGIDDYMTKPINYEELLWRINALLRRARIASENELRIGRFRMDKNAYTAEWNEEPVPLTNKEFDLLFLLLSYPETVFTKQQLMDQVWGYDSETEYDTIKTYVSRLRSKLAMCEEFELISLRGLGYKATLRERM